MPLTENQLNQIVYNSASKAEITERVIIPMHIPSDNIKAVDVSDLQGDQRVEMLDLLKQYKEYQEKFRAQMFNFEDWAEHTHNKKINPKWRTFSLSRIMSGK